MLVEKNNLEIEEEEEKERGNVRFHFDPQINKTTIMTKRVERERRKKNCDEYLVKTKASTSVTRCNGKEEEEGEEKTAGQTTTVWGQ